MINDSAYHATKWQQYLEYDNMMLTKIPMFSVSIKISKGSFLYDEMYSPSSNMINELVAGSQPMNLP